MEKFVKSWNKALDVGLDYYELLRAAEADDDKKMQAQLKKFWSVIFKAGQELDKLKKMA